MPLPPPNAVETDAGVITARENLEAERGALAQLEAAEQDKVAELDGRIADLKQAKIDVRTGDGTAQAVTDAEAAAETAQQELQAIRSDIDASEGAIEVLRARLRRERLRRAGEVRDMARAEYETRLAAAVTAMQDAEVALASVAEAGDVLRDEQLALRIDAAGRTVSAPVPPGLVYGKTKVQWQPPVGAPQGADALARHASLVEATD
jgi:hypothetical protein